MASIHLGASLTWQRCARVDRWCFPSRKEVQPSISLHCLTLPAFAMVPLVVVGGHKRFSAIDIANKNAFLRLSSDWALCHWPIFCCHVPRAFTALRLHVAELLAISARSSAALVRATGASLCCWVRVSSRISSRILDSQRVIGSYFKERKIMINQLCCACVVRV